MGVLGAEAREDDPPLIGPSVEDAQSICDEAAQGEVVSVANINAPGQIVIAGTRAGIERAIAGTTRPLPVAGLAGFSRGDR